MELEDSKDENAEKLLSDNLSDGSESNFLTLDSGIDAEPLTQPDEILIEKLIHSLHDVDITIQEKLDMIENADITIQVITYKIFEATHQFKQEISEVQEDRNKILSSIHNTSELSLILNDLDKKISDLESGLDKKIKELQLDKIALQEKAEAIMLQLDEDILTMQDLMKNLKTEFEGKLNTLYKSQALLINQKYSYQVDQLQEDLSKFEQLQVTGWKIEHSEVKLSELLEEQGLNFSPSGKLFTKSGSFITFEEAQTRGYLKCVTTSLDKIHQFFQERDQRQQAFDQIGPPDAPSYSEGSTADSRMSTEDVKYLKECVGKPLTLALAEIIAKQPSDPIHYLGHYLFKYRYNQELEEIQKKEIEELTQQRKLLAEERWKKFVEEEARNAVIDMILRAEKIAYENELKRIEQEQMMGEEEEGDGGEENQNMDELVEEAKDKFE